MADAHKTALPRGFLLAIFLLLLGVLLVWHAWSGHKSIEDNTREHLGSHARIAATHLATQLSSADAALATLQRDFADWSTHAGGWRLASRRLADRIAMTQGLRSLLLLDAAGNVLASNQDALIGKNFAHREYFQLASHAVDSARSILSPPFETVLGAWTFTLSRKIVGPRGDFAGVAVATFDPVFFSRTLESLLFTPDMRAVLDASDGTHILSLPPLPGPPSSVRPARAPAESLMFRHLASGQETSLQLGSCPRSGEIRLAALRTVQAEGGMLVVGISRNVDAMFDAWRTETLVLTLLYLAVAAASAGGLWMYQRRRRESLAAQERSQYYLDTVQTIMVALDAEGRITMINRAGRELLGYAESELLGRNWFAACLPQPEGMEQIYPVFQRVMTGDLTGIEYYENSVFCRDGRVCLIAWHNAYLRDESGRIVGTLSSGQDITEKKRTEAELDRHRQHLEELVAQRTAELAEARRKAEDASAAKSAFLANMSHEIRTPMNAILGLSHLLRRRVDDPVQQSWLDKIQSAGQHLLALINDILDFSKIEAGKLTLAEEDFVLGTVIDQVRSMVQATAEDKGLRIEVCGGELFSRWVHGDPIRLRQALLNYAGNAIKFTERGYVRIGVELVDEQADRMTLRFAVEDSGCGIDTETLARLFAPFEQGGAAVARKHGGTGLGLAITRRIAELMGGEAGATSTPGSGSRFWFTCRVQPGTQRPFEPVLPSSAEIGLRKLCGGARLLLAEDEPLNRLVTQEMLAETGIVIDTAEDGKEALAKAATGGYDIILMDVQMPVMNGLEATHALRALPAGRHIPVIAMTANAFNEDRAECLAAGMSDFLAKPVDPDELYGMLLKWLKRNPPA